MPRHLVDYPHSRVIHPIGFRQARAPQGSRVLLLRKSNCSPALVEPSLLGSVTQQSHRRNLQEATACWLW